MRLLARACEMLRAPGRSPSFEEALQPPFLSPSVTGLGCVYFYGAIRSRLKRPGLYIRVRTVGKLFPIAGLVSYNARLALRRAGSSFEEALNAALNLSRCRRETLKNCPHYTNDLYTFGK